MASGSDDWYSSSQFFQALHQLYEPSPGTLDRFPINHASIAIHNTHFMVLRCACNGSKLGGHGEVCERRDDYEVFGLSIAGCPRCSPRDSVARRGRSPVKD